MRTLVWANLIGLIATLTVNFLSNSLPLNGKTPAEISAQYPNLFVPAGLTFSIWGMIYLSLMFWVGQQVVSLFKGENNAKPLASVQKIGWLFVSTCALNILWLFCWHWEIIGISVVVMIALLRDLYRINSRLSPEKDSWSVRLPFGLYQGWITVALIANITALLVSQGWYPTGQETNLAVIVVGIGAALALIIVHKFGNTGHGLAVSWALFGIYLGRKNDATDGAEIILWWALILAVTVLAYTLLRTFRPQRA
ncbi:MAG: hypothetical protein IT269_04595 [Saprospiraceae bacterium]|nr:hypothetical protein [Saprospiraceae bacterium]